MAEQDEEHDMYVTQLREVFDSCDSQGHGRLDKNELQQLCVKLQLEDQSDALVQQLLSQDSHGRVGFDTFKEGFVAVLSETVEGMSSEDDLDEDTDLGTTGGSLSPKFLRSGRKKYGRRTIPDSTTSDLEGTTDLSEYTTSSRMSHSGAYTGVNSRVPSFDHEEDPYDDTDAPEAARRPPPVHPNSHNKSTVPETFEAEGQMNQNMCDLENALDPVSEEAHLSEIWRELGVGTSGYISLHELATVCQHIGMDEMSDEELSHLFDKLDVDQDGHVSFQEFLQGLFQHGGPATPASMTPVSLARVTPNRPVSTPRLKVKLQQSLNDGEMRHTPAAYVHLGSGLFSVLDTDNTGYASAEAVFELWESLGIQQGADILEFLQFDVRNKINLSDLSYALEQEFRNIEEDNATYQAAVVSYEQELRHLKHVTEQKMAERVKLKTAIAESNARISLLIKEGDERHATLERTKEKDLIDLETRCAEQVRTLHSDMDQERELLIQQSSKQRAKLQQQIEKLKEEETKLRDRLLHTQQALEKLESEMYDISEKAAELEKHNIRMQRELDEKFDLQRKLDELENSRANILDEQHFFSQQKLTQLEQDNKDLKDKSDELTMEIEELTQKLTLSRKQNRKTPTLREKLKRDVVPDSASEYSEDDTVKTGSGRQKRKLPERPVARSQSTTGSDDGVYTEEFASKMAEVKKSHNKELDNLERGYSVERKEVEDVYKLEIAQLEDLHMQEKNKIIKDMKKERDEVESEFAKKLEASLVEKEQNMREVFDEQIKEIKVKYDSERTLLQHAYADEKADIIKRMREEFDEELLNKLEELKERYEKELEHTVTRDRNDYDEDKRKIADLELQLKLQKEELGLTHKQKLDEQHQHFEAEKCQLEERHRLELLGYENTLSQGIVALKGQLKADFYRLLEEQKSEAIESEKARLTATASHEKDELVEEFTRQQENLVLRYKKDRREMETKYQTQVQNLEKTLTEEQHKSVAAQTHLQLELDREKEQLQLEREQLQHEFELETNIIAREQSQWTGTGEMDPEQLERERAIIEEQIADELHAQLEDEFFVQMERLKEAFEEERVQLESRIEMLQDEVDDINRTRDMEDRFRQQMETKSKQSEQKYKQQLQELTKANTQLKAEKHRIETRLSAVVEEKESAIQAVKLQAVNVSPPQVHTTSRYSVSPTQLLTGNESRLDKDHEQLMEEKAALQAEVTQLRSRVHEHHDEAHISQYAEAKLARWEAQNNALMTRLDVTSDKLSATSTALALTKSEHLREIHNLRDKYGNMVDINKYNNMNCKLIEAEKRITQLQKALEERTIETNRFITGSRDEHGKTVRSLEQEKAHLEKKLEATQDLLDDQVLKNKTQLQASTKTDQLVRDLYVENSNLMKCLQLSEKRGVNAEKNLYGIEEKCRVLHKVLGNVGASVALV